MWDLDWIEVTELMTLPRLEQTRQLGRYHSVQSIGMELRVRTDCLDV